MQAADDAAGAQGVVFRNGTLAFGRRQHGGAEALGNVAYSLAKAAKNLNVAIVFTAQLNNSAEGVVPRMSHIEGSGTIAAACEAVFVLDRPARRNPQAAKNRFDVLIEKNRDGEPH